MDFVRRLPFRHVRPPLPAPGSSLGPWARPVPEQNLRGAAPTGSDLVPALTLPAVPQEKGDRRPHAEASGRPWRLRPAAPVAASGLGTPALPCGCLGTGGRPFARMPWGRGNPSAPPVRPRWLVAGYKLKRRTAPVTAQGLVRPSRTSRHLLRSCPALYPPRPPPGGPVRLPSRPTQTFDPTRRPAPDADALPMRARPAPRPRESPPEAAVAALAPLPLAAATHAPLQATKDGVWGRRTGRPACHPGRPPLRDRRTSPDRAREIGPRLQRRARPSGPPARAPNLRAARGLGEPRKGAPLQKAGKGPRC